MKGIEIDFIRRPLPPWVGPAFFLVCATAFALSLGRFNDQRESMQARVAAERKAAEEALHPPPPTPDELKRQQKLGEERAALAYPWKSVFDVLEAAAGPDVKVTSFSHERRSRTSHLVLEATSFNSIDAALTRMKVASPAKVEWRVESITHESTGPAETLRATVAGSW